MKCSTCKDEKVIWEIDSFSRSHALACPDCNRNGQSLKEALYENNKLREKWGIKRK